MLLLSANADMLNVWDQIYGGLDLLYEDQGLTIYTTYEYRVTAYNIEGQVTSQPSDELTTFGGKPSKPAHVTAHAVNHTTIMVSWKTPSELLQ